MQRNTTRCCYGLRVKVVSLTEARSILPDRTLLLHIGAQKTGTTALQGLLADSRESLSAQGWTYLTTPGEINANKAVREIVRIPYIDRAKSTNEWSTLQETYRRTDTRNVVLSSEFLSSAKAEDLQPIVSALSGRTAYALLTVRSLHSALPSQWQEQMQRWQEKRTLNQYVHDALSGQNRHKASPHSFWLLHDYSKIISVWERLLGPGKVIVVCPEKNQPDFLFSAFEAILKLRVPLRHTSSSRATSISMNRSLSAEEAQTVYQTYNYLEEHYPTFFTDKRRLLNWNEYKSQVPFPRHGRALTVLPEAIDSMTQIANEIVEEICATSAQVIGSIASLSTHPNKIGGESRSAESLIPSIDVDTAGALIAAARMQGLHIRGASKRLSKHSSRANGAKISLASFGRGIRGLIQKAREW